MTNNTSTEEGNILVKLYRDIINKNKLHGNIAAMVEKYVDEENKKVDGNAKLKSSIKSTIVSDLKSSSITIKVFLKILIEVIRVKRLYISIGVELPNGKVSKSTYNIKTKYADDAAMPTGLVNSTGEEDGK